MKDGEWATTECRQGAAMLCVVYPLQRSIGGSAQRGRAGALTTTPSMGQ